MALQEDVEKAIRHGRSVIKKYDEEVLESYVFNEPTTRYAIIDPILTALGWKLDDPTRCRFEEWRGRKGQEYSGRLDYGLYKGKGKEERLFVTVESKALSNNLGGFEEEKQLFGYYIDPKPELWVLTTGSHWYFYDQETERGKHRPPDVNISCLEIDGQKSTIAKMAQKLIEKLSYQRF